MRIKIQGEFGVEVSFKPLISAAMLVYQVIFSNGSLVNCTLRNLMARAVIDLGIEGEDYG